MQTRIGILGGGQLGRMLLQCAANYHVETFVLESGKNPPASSLCHHFIEGDIKNYDAVYRFGKLVDVLTIEIENVNLEALFKLQEEGLAIFPKPEALKIIKDKGLQKEFYKKHNIPTAPFHLINRKHELNSYLNLLPVAQKLRNGGYDGKGVEILREQEDFHKAFDAPSVIESLVSIDKEISVIVAKNANGETAVYPPVEMVFDPRYNLVDYLISPAQLTQEQIALSQKLALDVMNALNSPGIYAVELFLDTKGNILVNETAPRAHNSGHQSIEGNYASQYEMQMRILQGLPLGNTSAIKPSLMLNLIGEPNHNGPVQYKGLDEVLKLKGVYVHLYGKHETKPGRKMGHVTILGDDKNELLEKAKFIKQTLKVVT
ncbi:MAG: phosphoribosylaminoimidazole carboxylase ATPase subunit [Bacteroidota bacterium]|nr:phosphoribosylaminoimidazole carboxylase ATPase subunit [Bacteroidota bacterium]